MLNLKAGQKIILKKDLLSGGYLTGDEVEVHHLWEGGKGLHLINKKGEIIGFKADLLAGCF